MFLNNNFKNNKRFHENIFLKCITIINVKHCYDLLDRILPLCKNFQLNKENSGKHSVDLT